MENQVENHSSNRNIWKILLKIVFNKIIQNLWLFLCVISAINVLFNHFNKLLLNIILTVSFFAGFYCYVYLSASIHKQYEESLKRKYPKNYNFEGYFKMDGVQESTPRSSQNNLNARLSVTGSYLIDDELHKIIEYFVRDYIDSWYKPNITNKEDFVQLIRMTLYSTIRQLSHNLKSIDLENFIFNILAHNLVIQMRMAKKIKEKRIRLNLPSISSPNSSSNSSATSNQDALLTNLQLAANLEESNLIDMFFELEAELEKGICRDVISLINADGEQEYQRDISELLCYSLFSSKMFNCLPLRCLIREIVSSFVVKATIDRVTDPDYINQSIIYLCQDHPTLTENFLTSIYHCENIDELNELNLQLDEDILRTRSNDKGGQNDQEIKLQLSSLQYVKRRIEICIKNLSDSLNNNTQLQTLTPSSNPSLVISLLPNSSNDSEYKTFLFNQHLSNLEFDVVISNEAIQHCFIEYMGKQNVQNLISFYLNAEMYRQFARKELSLKSESNRQTASEVRQALRDFSKGLINSYLLSASNFKATSQDEDDQPVNISNLVYYKTELTQTLDKIENTDNINENLLDDLQAKIYMLMKNKYYPDFRIYPEFQKILLKNDLIFKISKINNSDTNIMSSSMTSLDEDMNKTSNNSLLEWDTSSLSSMDEGSQFINESGQNANYKLSAVITSCGRCNEAKNAFAIYIIDVVKECEGNGEGNNKVDIWQTYRRFSDFHDLHLIIKKKFPNIKNLVLPGKSLVNSLSDEFLEKRKIELNKYLKSLCSPELIESNPELLDLLLKFLENKRWESAQTNFKRRVDSILTPMISSVQNIQTSIKNAPDNVLEMVKGISDNLLPDTSTPMTKAPSLTNSSQSTPKMTPSLSFQNSSQLKDTSIKSPVSSGKINVTQQELISIDRTTISNGDDIQSNNLPIKVILLLIDEIFDLKEKNQWLRQSLFSIIKSFMKSFKGDSMNRKFKEQIADYIKEERLARYLKNFRKRIWPKGILAEEHPERSKKVKQITKSLARAKILALVSDELRHILGSDTTRRGLFDLFDLFQHKPFNKRFLYILSEHLISTSLFPSISSPSFHNMIELTSNPYNSNSTYLTNPFYNLIRLHLSKSSKIKSEWKQTSQNSTKQSVDSNRDSVISSTSSNHNLSNSVQVKVNFDGLNNSNEGSLSSSIPRSNSFKFNEMNC